MSELPIAQAGSHPAAKALRIPASIVFGENFGRCGIFGKPLESRFFGKGNSRINSRLCPPSTRMEMHIPLPPRPPINWGSLINSQIKLTPSNVTHPCRERVPYFFCPCPIHPLQTPLRANPPVSSIFPVTFLAKWRPRHFASSPLGAGVSPCRPPRRRLNKVGCAYSRRLIRRTRQRDASPLAALDCPIHRRRARGY
jgi:hypothetical protein